MPAIGNTISDQTQTFPPIHLEKLFLPSAFKKAEERLQLGLDDLATEEIRWRDGQGFDAIRVMQNNVKAVTALLKNKTKQDRGQKQNTRSNMQVEEALYRRKRHMAAFTAARTAQIVLTGKSTFPELTEDDLYMKPVLEKRKLGDSKHSDSSLWSALAPLPSVLEDMDVDASDAGL
uniref:Uncharacterized protein n=1 Tax=Mycena chlorophos TaxID=658473 RepID=A0ABQ0L7R2_MYCCL|nr:predicted protein [Mycena chlorophos]